MRPPPAPAPNLQPSAVGQGPPLRADELEQEVRFAVVMYGGVSLAIYIHGVTRELFRLSRATQQYTAAQREDEPDRAIPYRKLGEFDGRTAVPDDQPIPTGTEHVYRVLSYLLADEMITLTEARRRASANEPLRTRFVIDILSGTSAGGVNAVYLAKALANGQSVGGLNDLWMKEGDFEELLNDSRSCAGTRLTAPDSPESLLNGRRMYLKLLEALNAMDGTRSDPFPHVKELDLFVTATDIRGMVVPLRLADKVVFELDHRQFFQFRYEAGSQNDFTRTDNPFLAFAARCTSAFPFAFEPMRLRDIDEVLDLVEPPGSQPSAAERRAAWVARFFKGYGAVDGQALDTRSFNDGGCLNNKPFTYATEALLRRQAEVPVQRKLLYIEPSPEHPEDAPHSPPERPNVVENVAAALFTLPSYQAIRQDLDQVFEHNRLMQRIK